MNLAALQAEHFRDVLEPYAVGVAVDEEHGRFGGPEFVGAEVERCRSHRFDVNYKIGEFVGRRAQFLVFDFDGRVFERFGRQLRERVEPFLDQAILAEPG